MAGLGDAQLHDFERVAHDFPRRNSVNTHNRADSAVVVLKNRLVKRARIFIFHTKAPNSKEFLTKKMTFDTAFSRTKKPYQTSSFVIENIQKIVFLCNPRRNFFLRRSILEQRRSAFLNILRNSFDFALAFSDFYCKCFFETIFLEDFYGK